MCEHEIDLLYREELAMLLVHEDEPEAADGSALSAATNGVQVMSDRTAASALPAAPGLYLFSQNNCLGSCVRIRGFCTSLTAVIPWTPKSALSVGAGALWDVATPGSSVPPRTVFPPGTTTRMNVIGYPPLAARGS